MFISILNAREIVQHFSFSLSLKKPTRALKAFSMVHRRLTADKMAHLVSWYFCGANSDYKINPFLKVNGCHFNCIYMYMTVSSGFLVWQEYLIGSTCFLCRELLCLSCAFPDGNLFAAIQDYRTFSIVLSQRFLPVTPIIPCAD